FHHPRPAALRPRAKKCRPLEDLTVRPRLATARRACAARAVSAGYGPCMSDPMQIAPPLPPPRPARPVPGTVLLVNPFYAKDVNASFGKHVLTPTLALTSLAVGNLKRWQVRYWDENLLQ